MGYETERMIYDQSLKLLLHTNKAKAKSMRFTAKDLHITYAVWDDLLSVFLNDKLVFKSELGKAKMLTKDMGWIHRLGEEIAKRKIN